ncbi:hypothetical protein NDA11_001257 [Ustilago hordei]|uniref:Uncharacterized protein n=1 Tax=Ustilago hordei TaxID=120017 RepID=I2FQH8_USTHO|nr:uncharacterized protein UHO2_05258 [Ustilago hordei]KAJ1042855.1 hypothetical protein NDA10_001493 [Ustilago hordei]KAJ1595992.1 hypothetical protein NDA11_001257 [Ustilago hordei]CCF49171.1 uncharacterized protein UHOR_07549 [Ustilago hordei]SYW80699.1 uncharacterized protein UHO2_05258 [Ustilago hordei]
MPPQTHDPDAESSDLSDKPHKERAPTAPHRQMLICMETPLCYNSNDNDDSDETQYNIDTISELNPEVLREPWKLHDLYCRLMMDLTKMEKITKLTLLNEVGRICMFQANIWKLIANINEHWAKAESMGHALPEILKVKTLICQRSHAQNLISVIEPCLLQILSRYVTMIVVL